MNPLDPSPDAQPPHHFDQPWQARAFALTVTLHRAGLFDWSEWTEALGAAIAAGGSANDADPETAYYECWLTALEGLLQARQIAAPGILGDLQQAWRRAAEATPHGQPIVLGADIATS